jgi:hypothetical protein
VRGSQRVSVVRCERRALQPPEGLVWATSTTAATCDRLLYPYPTQPQKISEDRRTTRGCLISGPGSEWHQSVRHLGECLRLRDPAVWDRVCGLWSSPGDKVGQAWRIEAVPQILCVKTRLSRVTLGGSEISGRLTTGRGCVKKRKKWRVLCNVNAVRSGRGPQTAASPQGSAQGQIPRCCHLTPSSDFGLNQVTWTLFSRARSSPQELAFSHLPPAHPCPHHQATQPRKY